MKKTLSLLFIFFIFTSLFSQLDREHWFAPMVDRTGVGMHYQKLYLSTNREIPFPVSIYNNNNTLIGTVTISKNNPQKYDVLREYIITTNQSDLFTPTTKGLHLKAEFPFYANLRFSVFNHAEIITSKGISSKGNLFYAASAPITVNKSILNFMMSVLATEDNTTVTISGYKNTVQFSNGMTGANNPNLTFTLDKGQSYIIDGIGDINGNSDGFVGSKIVSDKPINITNGNFNGQYAGIHFNSSDILMDQALPVNVLGNEFALVKGNGNIGSNMERALVIATEDNTKIYVNNETTTPLATLNTGQYYLVPDSKFILQGGAGTNHYNLYLKTSKNAYVYQLLAGSSSSGNEVATGGFNFIPALNCYLPKQINELGLIDENYVHSNNNPSGILNIPTKLNLITEKGATVTVNGAPPPSGTGPFNMTGTNNWVTYGIPNVSGTLTINSTKAITAGINAGSDAVGYGGFFAGFPTQPVIINSGESCTPGIVLTVDPVIYDSYQWYRNDILIPGATASSISPTQSGYYTCHVTMGNCTPLLTAPFKVMTCMKESDSSYDVCLTKEIIPSFSNSVQTPVPSTVTITNSPTLGTVAINPTTGILTYTVSNPGIAGTDTFTYKFCGNDPEFQDCETVTVTINIKILTVNNAIINACNNNGFGNFDLTSTNFTNTSPVNITYYPTLIDAQNEDLANLINNPTSYSATDGTIIYALVKSNTGCKAIAEITLKLYNLAVVDTFNQTYCDEDLDGTVSVNLPAITPSVLNNPSYFTSVRYYANLNDATAGNNSTLPNNWNFTTTTTIYIRVDSPDGCAPVIRPLTFGIGARIPLLSNNIVATFCDDDLDGNKSVDVSQYITQYTTDPSVTITYFSTLANAKINTNPISNIIDISGTQTVYLRFEKQGTCPEVAPLTVTIKIPKKSDQLSDIIICPKTKTTLDAGSGFDSYAWSTGASTSSISNVGAGTYWVDLTTDGCTYRQTVKVSESDIPVITSIEISGNTITVGAAGGMPPYEYSVDQINWQSSNVFQNLPRGNHIIQVRDRLNCKIISKPFVIINLINAITPNHDGHNDTIDYSSLMNNENIEFRIFDRYGTEVFRGDAANRFTWNGTIKGRPVNTATYWYFIQWKEFGSSTIIKYTSWLLVKNR